MILPLALLVSLLRLTNAIYTHKLKESIHPPSSNWVKLPTPPHPSTLLTIRIGLPQANFHTLEQHLYQIADPAHERYGEHLSKEEVEELVRPTKESVRAVDEWLGGYEVGEGDVVRSSAGDWVSVRLPLGVVEKMLDTKYSIWKHTPSNRTLLRTLSYSLPEHLHAHIEVIQPTTSFSLLTSSSVSSTGPGISINESCANIITISCLKQIYNIGGYEASKEGPNAFAVTGYLEQFANRQDLNTFYKQQVPEAVGSGFTFVSVNGGLDNQTPSEAGQEANLDTQFGFGLSFPIPGTYYSTGGRPPFIADIDTPTNNNEPYADWLDFVLSLPNPPYTISTSYADDEQSVPQSYAQRVCAGFAQLGARGVSVIFASGDQGVGDGNPDPATQTCFSNDGTNQKRFIPKFPASCPFVTSVGATTGIAPEVAVEEFGSGGGFSNYFPQPPYQKSQVQTYLKTLPKGTYAGLFNPLGRAYPDVSAQGDNFLTIVSGAPALAAGTSCSAPTFGAIVALLNDARVRAGRPSLGFLNPMLYMLDALDGGLNDVVSGSNPGCGTGGFNATKGWDPVTGLGTPDFGKLKDVVLAF